MSSTFDLDEVSDREILPRTPTLAGSTSSLDDSLLQSPFSARFLGPSTSSPTKRSSYPGARVPLEGNCKAWWGKRASADSSNWRASLELRPYEQGSSSISSRERLRPLQDAPSQSDETPSATPAPTLNDGQSVSGAKRSPPPDVEVEELDVEHDAKSESSCHPHLQRANTPAGLSQSSISSLPILGLNPTAQPTVAPEKTYPMNVYRAASDPLPYLSIAHQSTDSESMYAPPVGLAPHLNVSRANSSMLAQCDQGSLAPPCVRMTQTQCGRSALREAGIAHGSPRALAPSLPIENIPNQSQNGSFFRRLVRKTLSISSFTISSTGSHSLPVHPSASIGNQKSHRSWPTRRGTMPVSTQNETLPRGQASLAPKRSAWSLIQRFVAKPGTATKGVGANITRRNHARPMSSGIDYTRRHTIISGHSSSVSFFGDPLVRNDPFARSDGLGATVSPTGADSSEQVWNESPHTGDHDAHIVGFTSREPCERPQSATIDKTGTDDPSLCPLNMSMRVVNSSSGAQAEPTSIPASSVNSKSMDLDVESLTYCPNAKRMSRSMSRRHSAPMLGKASRSPATNP